MWAVIPAVMKAQKCLPPGSFDYHNQEQVDEILATHGVFHLEVGAEIGGELRRVVSQPDSIREEVVEACDGQPRAGALAALGDRLSLVVCDMVLVLVVEGQLASAEADVESQAMNGSEI